MKSAIAVYMSDLLSSLLVRLSYKRGVLEG